MTTTEIENPIFREALEAIDAGDITLLKKLLTIHPELITDCLNYPNGGYFKDPYLLWFVADNPIRVGKLPANIVEVTRLLIQHVRENDKINAQQQLDYALTLVETGRIPRECGMQIEMIDLLLDAGAELNGIMGAVTNGNIDAAKHLLNRGAELKLPGAVCLDRMDDVIRLAAHADADEKLTALTAAAFYGNTIIIAYLLGIGTSPNGYPPAGSGFHHRATPLHQAVSSKSLNAVKLLVEAGANLQARDKVYDGTPLDWAEYLQKEDGIDETMKNQLALIADYLRSSNVNV